MRAIPTPITTAPVIMDLSRTTTSRGASRRRDAAASLTTVTDARQKLLGYGQPALKAIRTQATPRIADTFHLFLLSLYESLAQAATPPGSAPGPPPKP